MPPVLTVTVRHRRALVAATLAAAVAVAGCSSSSGSSAGSGTGTQHTVLGDAAAAMAKEAGTAKGSITLTQGNGSFASKWQGYFTSGRGVATGTLPGTGKPALDARWTKGQIYVRRTASVAEYGNSPIGQLAAVKPDTALWMAVPASNIASRVFAPVSPPDLVLALASLTKQTVTDGPKIGGATTRKVTVEGPGLLFNWIGVKRAEVLLDGHDLARRVTVSFGREKLQVDVAYSKVSPSVQPPSAADLATRTPPPPGPIGPFLAVRTGTDAGVAWTLQKAPGRNGTDCWRWSSTPPLAVVQPNYLTDTRCVAPMTADPGGDPSDQVDFLLWTDGAAPSAAVVARFPQSITQATLGFVGGRTETVPVSGGLLTWVGPSSEPLGYVGLQDGGTAIQCGVASVTSTADLTNESLVGDPFHSAWSCQS
jgi:hypothetical protein